MVVHSIAMVCAAALLAFPSWGAEQRTNARLIKRPELKVRELNSEGMVYVRFMVSAKGEPTEIEIMKDHGFFSTELEKLSLKYVKGMRFAPATNNGVPTVFGPLVQRINFSIQMKKEEQGVTPEFRAELEKVDQLIKEKDYAGAHFHAQWMLREKVTFNYEYAVLQAQLAQTLALDGRVDEALQAAWGATSRSGTESTGFTVGEAPPPNDPSNYLLPRPVIVYLLDLRMRLLAQKGQVLGALKTYNELAGLEAIQDSDPRMVFAGKLTEILQGNSPLAFDGEVTREYWSHDLYHPRFTVTQVDGTLGKGHLHCRGEYREFDFVPGEVWTVPTGWERCTVEFYGEPGTKIKFVEMPANVEVKPDT